VCAVDAPMTCTLWLGAIWGVGCGYSARKLSGSTGHCFKENMTRYSIVLHGFIMRRCPRQTHLDDHIYIVILVMVWGPRMIHRYLTPIVHDSSWRYYFESACFVSFVRVGCQIMHDPSSWGHHPPGWINTQFPQVSIYAWCVGNISQFDPIFTKFI
jgi:hypothetical protein